MDRKKSGFTLAELLIVVAIIAVLVAISIPVFSSQLEKARRAVDVENARNIRSVLANAINDGSFVFNNKDAMLEVVVSRNEKNGGFSGNNGQVKNDLIINGVQYHNASDGNLHGYKLVWDFLEKNGIQKNLTMKQKKFRCYLVWSTNKWKWRKLLFGRNRGHWKECKKICLV